MEIDPEAGTIYRAAFDRDLSSDYCKRPLNPIPIFNSI
ncbi:hypothetical protein GW12_17310 [Acinetobacter sp. HR7]|nr:hypothetical protein GW12_17310 [Acinetobacter sp. HR7]